MTIYSLVAKRIEDGGWTGVCRFDQMLRRVFPGLESITPAHLPSAYGIDDVVIADNHLSTLVPDIVKTIVVHHGCAETHYDRDPYWRNDSTRNIVELQRRILDVPNRKFVAPSQWVADQFWPRQKRASIRVIPHWVDPIPSNGRSGNNPIIIGDWRDWNKGSGIWSALAAKCPQWDFRQLSFKNESEKIAQYGSASLFLGLSLSEGAGYALADAEAAGLPIVTTDTGLYLEFNECTIVPWWRRDDLDLVAAAIARQLENPGTPAFYRFYSFNDWAAQWREVVQ
jgi:hypothetical protein